MVASMRDLRLHNIDISKSMHIYKLWVRETSTMYIVEAPTYPQAVDLFRCHEESIKFEESYSNVWYGKSLFLDPYNKRYRIKEDT